MIVNGVTLPDIPADVLADYPYVFIVKQTISAPGVSMTGYSGLASTSPFAVLPPNMSEYIEPPYEGFDPGEEYRFCFTEHSGVRLDWSEEDSSETWTINEMVKDYGDFGVWAADCTGPFFSEDATITNETVWANHDICVATGIAGDCLAIAGTEVYFANSSTPAEPKPTRVSIGRSLVDGYAKEVQRLTGTTDQMNAIQIREKLSTVKAAIKIGDTVLPPIPENVLAEYPYAVIVKRIENGLFRLMPSKNVFTHLISGEYETISDGTTEQRPIYDYDESNGKWVENGTGTGFSLIFGGVLTYEMVWSNVDIKDKTTGEVYFSERQNFNGVWLPKIPADVLVQYPYAVIIRHDYGTGVKYSLRVTSNHWRYIGRELLESVMGSGVLGTADGVIESLDEPFMVVYNCSVNASSWSDGVNNNDVMFPVGTNQADTVTPIWSNQDIYIATGIDVNAGTVILGTDIYFPPLPAIDTDRVSIGYDLCDGIVEEVQRLSGDQDKMNALRAYWKLTTVV